MRDRKNRFSQKAILTYDNYNSYLAAQNFEKKKPSIQAEYLQREKF